MTTTHVANYLAEAIRRHWEWSLAAVLVPTAWLMHSSYGMAWDDAVHALYGSRVLDYFLSGFSDMRWRDDMGLLKLYGPVFDLPSAAVHRALGCDLLRFRAFLMALVGIFAVPAVAGIGRIVGGERCAALSVASLLMMPQFVGQSFINCKDIPLATAFSWACLMAMRLGKTITWKRIVGTGLFVGMAMAIRINGGILALAFITALLGFRVLQRRPWNLPLALVANDVQHRVQAALAVAAVALTLLVAIWPYAQLDPLGGPWEAFRAAEDFPETYRVLFAGQSFTSNELPWHYLPTMLSLTAPLTIVFPMMLGTALCCVALARTWTRPAAGPLFLLVLWIAFPIAYVMIRRPNIYDGVRHFLFVLPAAAVLTATGLERLAATASRPHRHAGVLVIAAWVVFTAPVLVMWHPYQYVFHNVLAGNRLSLHERFETDYWMTSYREAASLMNGIQSRSGRPLHLIVGANQYSVICYTYFALPTVRVKYGLGLFTEPSLPDGSDYFVTIPRYGMWRNFPKARVAHEIRRCGVLLCAIKEHNR